MEINMTNKRITWYKDEKKLAEVEIPKELNPPFHAYFALKNAGDSC
jgi:hypothetical protein